eukprot:CAMPEP_0119012258 /NCGR_PEP_ID=MMETSP1176-20130426/6177_1 /TAXON_ID=265551 /ORGANISM="Synedropsis recta cf, Strain CCMP1620" /LENGTH=133 /DNA_ID=CAMNT_0006965179 /DNA_START=356 /DNA_END=757 /DNA_ORIENTATION=+
MKKHHAVNYEDCKQCDGAYQGRNKKYQDTQVSLQLTTLRVALDTALLIAVEVGWVENVPGFCDEEFDHFGDVYDHEDEEDDMSCSSVDSIKVTQKRLGCAGGFYNNGDDTSVYSIDPIEVKKERATCKEGAFA